MKCEQISIANYSGLSLKNTTPPKQAASHCPQGNINDQNIPNIQFIQVKNKLLANITKYIFFLLKCFWNTMKQSALSKVR